MDSKLSRAAGTRLAKAWLERGSLDVMLEAELRPQDRAEAFAIQDVMAEIIAEPVVGWKMGATSPAVRRHEGHNGPIIGRIFASTLYDSGAQLPAEKFPSARIEGEFGIRFLRDLPPRAEPYSATEIADCIELVPTLEIIGNRYPKGPGAPVLTTDDEIADNGTGIGLVVGQAAAHWSAAEIQSLQIAVSIDGGPAAENVLGDDRCVPLEVAAETATILSQRGIGIFAGQIVSTGGCTTPQHVTAGSHFVADFGPLGVIEGRFV